MYILCSLEVLYSENMKLIKFIFRISDFYTVPVPVQCPEHNLRRLPEAEGESDPEGDERPLPCTGRQRGEFMRERERERENRQATDLLDVSVPGCADDMLTKVLELLVLGLKCLEFGDLWKIHKRQSKAIIHSFPQHVMHMVRLQHALVVFMMATTMRKVK